MKTITVGRLRQNPAPMLAEVERGETYSVTRHGREIARIVPRDHVLELVPPRRATGSRLADLPRHELRTASSIDELLADERDRCHLLSRHVRRPSGAALALALVRRMAGSGHHGMQHVVVSSRILRTELTRVLRREGLPITMRDEVLDVLSLVPVTEGVLAAYEAIGPHVKTLDAIHLGSVIAAGLDATIVSHDSGMIAAAEVLGYPTVDPVQET